jgi:hypothetical protein
MVYNCIDIYEREKYIYVLTYILSKSLFLLII